MEVVEAGDDSAMDGIPGTQDPAVAFQTLINKVMLRRFVSKRAL